MFLLGYTVLVSLLDTLKFSFLTFDSNAILESSILKLGLHIHTLPSLSNGMARTLPGSITRGSV